MLAKFLLYIRTAVHLKPKQILARLTLRRRVNVREMPPCKVKGPEGTWVTPIAKANTWLGDDEFRFLNESHRVAFPSAWNDKMYSKLWLYNLHYFDGLHGPDVNVAYARQVVDRWISENPRPHGNRG